MSALLWHCGFWYGPAAHLYQEHRRADPEAALPPVRIRQWLRKPESLRPVVYQYDIQAAQWLREQMENVARHLAAADERWWSRIEAAYSDLKREVLACHDVEWSHEVPRGMAVYLAVVVEYIQENP